MNLVYQGRSLQSLTPSEKIALDEFLLTALCNHIKTQPESLPESYLLPLETLFVYKLYKPFDVASLTEKTKSSSCFIRL